MPTTHPTVLQKLRRARVFQSIALGTVCSVVAFSIGMETAGDVHPFATSEAAADHAELPAQPYAALQGDINRDGIVTAADALLMLEIAEGLEEATPETVKAGDIDGDFRVTTKDVLRVLRTLSLR